MIWQIQITKYGRRAEDFAVDDLARATEGFTGSEIEQAFIDGLYDAFTRREEPSDLSVTMQLSELVPLSRLMNEQIAALRHWANGRARLATRPKVDSINRRILAKS